MKVLQLGAESSVIIDHLVGLLAQGNSEEQIQQGVVVYGIDGRKELGKLDNVCLHSRPGTESRRTLSKAPSTESPEDSGLFISKRNIIAYLTQFGWLNRLRAKIDVKLRRGAWADILSQYDVVNLHSMFWGRECEVVLDQYKGKLVVSIWGSDLLRESNLSIVKKQKKLLERADIITVSGLEFREVLLAKFGRSLKPKIREAFFSIGGEVVDEILTGNKVKAHKKWCEECDFPANSKIVVVGHNGSKSNNHLSIIKELDRLEPSFKKQISLILPMTYGLSDEGYLREIKNTLKASGIRWSVLSSFMAEEAVADLRLACNIFIYAPESDAFSASVSQALMAQSIVICGSWLPYGARRQYGFEYLEFDCFEKLPVLIKNVLLESEAYEERVIKNKQLSVSFFEDDCIRQGWKKAYNAAAQI